MTSAPWWSNAVIYAVDAATYQDSDGDGVGDLAGLRQSLDHIADLGATCIWLLPFYESPNRDGRYDVTDHCRIDSALGTRDEFDGLLESVHERGMRLIVDLIASHTSDRHAWFRAARSGDPRFRDYYVWRDEPDHSLEVKPIFPGISDSVWTYDETAGQYYLHRFYEHEPDLNTGEAEVQEQIRRTVRFWLDAGVDGFRVDAAPYIASKAAWSGAGAEGMAMLGELAEFVAGINSEAILMPEADVDPSEYPEYVEAGMHLVLDFYTNNQLFLSLARRSADPLRSSINTHARNGASPHLAQWIRNHDELDLERLTENERAEVYECFAPTERERVYGRGIRRRLPPMLAGDRSLVELTTSIVFSLPGVPVLRYGEEIGMGDDLDQPERLAVRTVMQWTGEPGAGFSGAGRENWEAPLIESGPFGHGSVNVADQAHDPSSLLCWTRRLVRTRRECPQIGRVAPEVLDSPSTVLALRYRSDHRDLLVVHNLGREVQALNLPIRATEIFPGSGPVEDGLELAPASTRWLALD